MTVRLACGETDDDGASASSQRPADGGHGILVGRELSRLLSGDQLIADPHGELTATPFNEIGLEAGFFLDQGCHTGSVRAIVSHLAVADANRRHGGNLTVKSLLTNPRRLAMIPA